MSRGNSLHPFMVSSSSSSSHFRMPNRVHVICLNMFTDWVRHSLIGCTCCGCCCSKNTHGHFNRQYSALCESPAFLPPSWSRLHFNHHQLDVFLFPTSCHFSNPKQSLNGAIRLGNEQLQLIVFGINLIIEKWREKNWWNGIESSSCFQSKICCPLEGRVLSGRRGRGRMKKKRRW